MFNFFKYRFLAARDVWVRYRRMFSLAWRFRHTTDTPKRNRDEAEFLPSALAVQEKPVSNIARWTARAIIVFILFLLAWSYFGKMDVVVTANGKIITTDKTKSIASVDTANILNVHVQEGQAVKAGELLMELDASSVMPELDKSSLEYQDALAQAARARALLRAIDSNSRPKIEGDSRISGLMLERAQAQVESTYEDMQSKIRRVENDFNRYSDAAKVYATRAQDMERLLPTGDVSRHEWLEMVQKQNEFLGQARDAHNQGAMVLADTRKQAFEEMTQALRAANVAEQDSKRNLARTQILRLTSPVDGVVQQLRYFTVGGVVPAAEPIMQIVPKNDKVEVEAMVENKDIGYVNIGSRAAVKVQTYEYTKYGTLDGLVTFVGKDAIENEDGTLLFPCRIALDQNFMLVGGRQVSLSAGMSVTADIKTGDRRIIEYFLSPLQQHKRESLNER